jgi:perosamine synthetase
MFKFKREIGDHKIFNYDLDKYNFIEYFKNLYNETNLEMLHLKSNNYQLLKEKLSLGELNEIDTDLHKIFYTDIKSNNTFKELYCKFIINIYKDFFPDEKYMIYQSFPSIRIQYMESVVIPPHKDSDHISNHPLGEKNFLIPITKMENTNSIYIESKPEQKDFQSITLNIGELFYFNGNMCTHYNEKNLENKLRISIDFRVILHDDYIKYINTSNLKKTNPRDLQLNREPTLMIIGNYYQCHHKDVSLENILNWYKRKDTIIQHRPFFGKEEAEATYKYMLEDSFITEHIKTRELENIICNYIGCKNCIMTTSGTSALILALMSLDLQDGDEVIVPNYTMIASINSIKFIKLVPVIIDVDEKTFTLNLNTIKENVTSKTKAILHVSLNNRYNDLESIADYCKYNNIYLVEDSAQSLGCKINNKSLGTFGKIGCFSLSTPKIISTGQGGFCVTDDDEIAKKINMIKNFGRKESGKDNFVIFGINLKFTDIQAVIGIEQMKKIDYRVKRMREIYNLYYNQLKDIIDMCSPLSDEWIPWFVDIYIKNRIDLIEFLSKHGIQTRPVYGEINKTNVYFSEKVMKNSNYVCNNGLFLPSHINLSDQDILFICNIIKVFYHS